ncbi:MAG: Ig-like domain-containing protein [bacterium]
MLYIVKNDGGYLEIPISVGGLQEETKRIKEMGRIKTWVITTPPMRKNEYLNIKEYLEKPTFIGITGKILYPKQEKMLYIECKSKIINDIVLQDGLLYKLEFELQEAHGLYGGPLDITPIYSTIKFEILGNNNEGIKDAEIKIYGITKKTDVNGIAEFKNFYTLKRYNFNTQEWELNEEELSYTIEKEGTIQKIKDSLYVDQEYYNISLSIPTYEENVSMSVNSFKTIYEDMYYDIEFEVIDYETGNPISNAEVKVTSSPFIDIQKTKTGITDSNGKVIIERILIDKESGDYTVNHPDYYTIEGGIKPYGKDGELSKFISNTVNLYKEETVNSEGSPPLIDGSGISISNFGIEYIELLLTANLTIYDENNDIVEGAVINYTDSKGNDHIITTDINGQVTLENIRAEENHDIVINNNDVINNITLYYSEQEANDNDWVINDNIIILNNGTNYNFENSYNTNVKFDNLKIQGGYYIDFTDVNELDNWTSRYISDYEDWQIVEDNGNHYLKHTTTQNFRRLFSYDPLWKLQLKDSFGYKAIETVEILSKVKTTQDHGNQNRLYLRAGLNIDEPELNENINLNCDIKGIIYDKPCDIKFNTYDDNNNILDGVTVTLHLDYSQTIEEVSNSNGEVIFSGKNNGSLLINYVASRPGYEDAEGTITLQMDTEYFEEDVNLLEI